ncbi:hypothetical protein ACIQVK_06130 [Streptomyces sp. NPDC090493]
MSDRGGAGPPEFVVTALTFPGASVPAAAQGPAGAVGRPAPVSRP